MAEAGLNHPRQGKEVRGERGRTASQGLHDGPIGDGALLYGLSAKALLREPVDLTVGSITYYLDPDCYTSRGIKVDPGLMDVVGRLRLPRLPRRVLKLMEGMLNLCALTVRFTVSPPDVIHVQYLPMLRTPAADRPVVCGVLRRRGSKIVLTVHDLLPHDTGEEYRAKFDKLYRRVDAIICHSDTVRARLATEFSVPEEKMSVIAHGPFFYDFPATGGEEKLRSFALEPGKVMVLWQGIIFPYKGIDVLLRAWQQVETRHGEACLVIAGTGAPELLQEIRAQVEELGLKQVKLHFRLCQQRRVGGAVSRGGRRSVSLSRDYNQRRAGDWTGAGKGDCGQRSAGVSRAADGP